MKLPFKSIVRLDLKYVSLKRPDVSFDLILAMSRPYKKNNLDALRQYACKIISCDDPAFVNEIVGQTKIAALESTLLYFNNFIDSLQKSDDATLMNSDGTPFVKSSSDVFLKHLEKLQKYKLRSQQ
jgi:hypothetical protein